MAMHPSLIDPVPEETARVARAAFRKGTLLMRVRDEIGVLYEDAMFADLYHARGQWAIAPWRLALVTLFQFLENLSDRQAAEAVRSRIDWKYALGLELTDPGFDFSVLCEFRARLLAGGQDQCLLEILLERLGAHGLIKSRGKQRTDSTHVLAAIRTLNRLEFVGETLRAALHALAQAALAWLVQHGRSDWAERYGARVEQYRLPKSLAARQALAEAIGTDGHDLLVALLNEREGFWPDRPLAVERLRLVWIQQFYHDGDSVRWREPADQPPVSGRLHSPYDPEARYAKKRNIGWIGYKVHLTETCDADRPHLITDVQTTAAGLADVAMTATVHSALASRGLLPAIHAVDSGYVNADLLVASRVSYALELLGPALPDSSRQAQAGQGFDLSAFTIDWSERIARCPAGQISQSWKEERDERGVAVVRIGFSQKSCNSCPSRVLCSPFKPGCRANPRRLTILEQPAHEALQARRREQNGELWKTHYACRAGIEGTLSQGIRSFGLRRCRYLGQAKTHLQHVCTAAAMNLVRVDAWLRGQPRARTRQSQVVALLAAA
ncbi:IS1182 family transposase [Paracoccus acridae]|nr:IS1182 family transposase [Paracoccus acridae]